MGKSPGLWREKWKDEETQMAGRVSEVGVQVRAQMDKVEAAPFSGVQ
jgi:hypothetical protein